ncbi:MAG: right-handed parallel beta-helix repeat-containing protein [Bacteroidota bacterium]|nr:right-handed parallel beta-helix repeat-containing protein [Bacteroidota bacterium]
MAFIFLAITSFAFFSCNKDSDILADYIGEDINKGQEQAVDSTGQGTSNGNNPDNTDTGTDSGAGRNDEYDYGSLKAFPTAMGAGGNITGGRGGKIIHVTTLNWSGPGSLKEAIQTPGKRIIVFDVSGEIDATSQGAYSPIIKGSSYNDMTIAGQTAPQGGITLRTTEFMFENVSNVILRYIRFRQSANSAQDALWFVDCSDLIIDHCTFSHGGDEAGSVASSTGISGNVTIQNCFFQDSKTGSILGVDNVDGDFTFTRNLYTNISHRFPNPKGDGQYDIINNVVYNWKYRLVRITGEGTYNIINNYYKPASNGLRLPGWFGNNVIPNSYLQKVQTQSSDTPLIYAAGSVVTGQRDTPKTDDSDMFTVFAGSNLPENSAVPASFFTSSQFPLIGMSYDILSAQDAYRHVLENAGANAYLTANGNVEVYRDDKDAADLQEIINDSYSGSFYDARTSIPYPIVPENDRPSGYDTDNDGMPDLWEIAKGFNPQLDDSAEDKDGNGYTNIEEFLNLVDVQ